MTSFELKTIAKQKTAGKMKDLALITFIYSIIIGACNYVYSPLTLIVGGPLSLGLAITYLNVTREDRAEIASMFSGFQNFGTALVLHLLNSLFIALWSLLLIIPGIVKFYSYSMSFYLLADDPCLSATEARKRSEELMNGHKMRLFKLHLSYIGWILLSVLTLGILLLWVMPQIQTATAEFYNEIYLASLESHNKGFDAIPADDYAYISADTTNDDYITIE